MNPAICRSRFIVLTADSSAFGGFNDTLPDGESALSQHRNSPGDHPIFPKQAASWSICCQGGKSHWHLRALFGGQKTAVPVQIRCYISWTDRIDLDARVPLLFC